MLREFARSKLGIVNVCVNVAFCAFDTIDVTLEPGTLNQLIVPYGGLANIDVRAGETAKDLIKLIEKGILKIESGSGMKATGKFGPERWDEAVKASATESGLGNAVYFIPNGNGLC
ncbi:hypothetical protein K449DRAFT_394658 [Hypoxylon sp. EC38]|nr:hypothetical protein K449DRAFT_394658 [Hypoxylon sp. EC38]